MHSLFTVSFFVYLCIYIINTVVYKGSLFVEYFKMVCCDLWQRLKIVRNTLNKNKNQMKDKNFPRKTQTKSKNQINKQVLFLLLFILQVLSTDFCFIFFLTQIIFFFAFILFVEVSNLA